MPENKKKDGKTSCRNTPISPFSSRKRSLVNAWQLSSTEETLVNGFLEVVQATDIGESYPLALEKKAAAYRLLYQDLEML